VIVRDYGRYGSRIVIEDGAVRRALFKIQPLPDGGYAVLAPYHDAREGWLARQHVDYRQTDSRIRLSDMEHFTASDRVKLSHHRDGFVQFSGEVAGTIISGRDAQTGEPRGLAVQSAPIGLPITTGPTFGCVSWGISSFRALPGLRRSDLLFPAADIYYRRCRPDTWNAYLVEGWVFWPPMWAGVHGDEYNLRLSVGFRNFEGSGANLEFRVIPLRRANCFLGISVHKTRTAFPSASGFQIAGPSDRRRGSTTANALIAMYPRFEETILNARPLDYVAPVQPPSDPAMLGPTTSGEPSA